MAKKMTPGNMYRGYRNPFMGGYGGYGSRRGKLTPGFVDYGAVVSQRIQPGLDRMITARKKKEEAYAEQINNMGAVDYQKLPEGLKPKLQATMQEEYANMKEGSRLMLTSEVGSDNYMKGKTMYDTGVSNIKGYNSGLDKLLQVRTDGQTSYATGAYSAANNNASMNTHFGLVSGRINPDDFSFGGGVVGFGGQNIANYVNPSYKNADVVTGIDNFYTTNYNESVKGTPYNTVVGNAQLTSILTDAKGDGRKSLAYDWLIPDPSGSGRKLSFATAYGVERPANMSDADFGKMLTEIEKSNPDRLAIARNYEAGLYNDEKGAVGGTGRYDNWILDPAMDDILHNEEIKFFGNMTQQITEDNVKAFNQNKKNEQLADLYKMVSGIDIPEDQYEYNNILDRAKTTIEGTDIVKQWKLRGEPGKGGANFVMTGETMDNLVNNIIDMLRIEPNLDGIIHLSREQAYEGEWDDESKTYVGGFKQRAETQGLDSSKAAFDKAFPKDRFQIFESRDDGFFGAASIDIKKHFKYDTKTKKWSMDENVVKEIQKSVASYVMTLREQGRYVHGFDNGLLNQNPTRIMEIATQLYNASNTASTTN